MNAVGIIAEYNPFHNGHAYQLQEALRLSGADCAVCVMSGDFLQRGEPAFMDKWTRAEMAVAGGADLVLELPFAFAVNSARYFAMAGVSILKGLGAVTHISFGSEAGDNSLLAEAAQALSEAPESPELSAAVRDALAEGKTYPAARHQAACRIYGERIADLLLSPNNILAIEYLKQNTALNAGLIPVTVKRRGAAYHQERLLSEGDGPEGDGAAGGFGMASAKAIRNTLTEGMAVLTEDRLREAADFLPTTSLEILRAHLGEPLVRPQDFYPLAMYRLLVDSAGDLAQVASVGEGLEHRLKSAAQRATDMESLMDGIRSKRYSKARIRRLLIHTIVGLSRRDFTCFMEQRPFYARVLGFSEKGAALLSQIRKGEGREGEAIPVLTNINRQTPGDTAAERLLHYDILASDLYHLVKEGETYQRSDHVMRPVMKK